ncbi:MAG: DUF4065 domain-containing protein [Nevskiaceae bacterium]|jgi:uncharacterized phage-associated protein|nr:DUF4065 domain-containing protein [Nevskiaceae bacterium]
MTFSAATAANALLQRAFKEGRPDVTPMKLQKLLWFLNGWHLAIYAKPAVFEPFEAWKYGPVVASLYHSTKKYGGNRVSEYIPMLDEQSGTFKAFVPSASATGFRDTLDLTWEKYIGSSAIKLSAMTHMSGSPWAIARERGEPTISNATIQEYFVGLARPERR